MHNCSVVLFLALFLGIFLFSLPAFASDRIQNARTYQQGNRIVAEYTLTGDKPAQVNVMLIIKDEKYTAEKLHLEGDYGKNVTPGRKKLIWNLLQDFPRGFSGEYTMEITAAGGGGTDPTTGMEFVEVPAGCFQMGDTFGDGGGDEKPVHEVCVDGFSMGKYEVTNAQYRKFKSGHSSGDYKGNSLNGDNQPVVTVSWNDALEYARWLSRQSGKTYRLPTEAEWEYAARGGTSTRNYWGNGKDDACSYANAHDLTSKRAFSNFTWEHHNCNDGYAVTAPAGSFKPNAFGLYDMSGNAWEWVSDWYGDKYYQSSPRNNPQGASSGTYRVLRGGSWYVEPGFVRSSFRDRDSPGFRYFLNGFRVVSPP